MSWFLKVVRDNYANFSGRARRAEYWYYTLFYLLIYVGLFILDIVLAANNIPGVLALLFALAMFIPSIAVCARRLHDTGRTGWWQLISFIPFIGAIVLLVFLVQEGSFDRNEYGPSPKKAPAV